MKFIYAVTIFLISCNIFGKNITFDWIGPSNFRISVPYPMSDFKGYRRGLIRYGNMELILKSKIADTYVSLLYVGNAFAGESSGYTVSNVTPGCNYEKLGLQTGDVILSYDGKSVDSPKD